VRTMGRRRVESEERPPRGRQLEKVSGSPPRGRRKNFSRREGARSGRREGEEDLENGVVVAVLHVARGGQNDTTLGTRRRKPGRRRRSSAACPWSAQNQRHRHEEVPTRRGPGSKHLARPGAGIRRSFGDDLELGPNHSLRRRTKKGSDSIPGPCRYGAVVGPRCRARAEVEGRHVFGRHVL